MNISRTLHALAAFCLAGSLAACGGGGGSAGPTLAGTPAGTPDTPVVANLDGTWTTNDPLQIDVITERKMSLATDAANRVTGSGTWCVRLVFGPQQCAGGALRATGTRTGNEVQLQITLLDARGEVSSTRSFAGVVGGDSLSGTESENSGPARPVVFARKNVLNGTWAAHGAVVADSSFKMTLAADGRGGVTGKGSWRAVLGPLPPHLAPSGPVSVSGTQAGSEVQLQITLLMPNGDARLTLDFHGTVRDESISGTFAGSRDAVEFAREYPLQGTWRNRNALVADAPEVRMTLSVDAFDGISGTGTWKAGFVGPNMTTGGRVEVTGSRDGNKVNLQTTYFDQDRVMQVLYFSGEAGDGVLAGAETNGRGEGVPVTFDWIAPN